MLVVMCVTYTMMLLMGMCISLTKNPINPMMAKPMAVAMAIFWNSVVEKKKMLCKLIDANKTHTKTRKIASFNAYFWDNVVAMVGIQTRYLVLSSKTP